ncbi:MAG: hypothetical protein ABI779_20415 [Acidobacteriota bacterium]
MATRLLGRRLRFSPRFRPVPIASLTVEERLDLGDLRDDGELAVVLLPTMGGFSAKAVCAATAGFLARFESPAELAAEDHLALGNDDSVLVRMIVDGVLEVEEGMKFISGAAAAELLGLEATLSEPLTAPARVSLEALRYGALLQMTDAPSLSARLYAYNREPLSPRWTRRIPSARAFDDWIGMNGGSPFRRDLLRAWVERPPLPDNPRWIHFRARRYDPGRFKLYVSPRAESFPEMLRIAATAFEEHGISAFKLARDLPGALRPDKLVAYARSGDQVFAAADAILRRASGMPPQVVPFTAPAGGDGLVSWGIDPPRSEHVSNWQGTSWRRWLTDRLAVALTAACAAGASSAVRFALQRIALEGVDVQSWTPAAMPWDRASA